MSYPKYNPSKPLEGENLDYVSKYITRRILGDILADLQVEDFQKHVKAIHLNKMKTDLSVLSRQIGKLEYKKHELSKLIADFDK